MCQLRSGAPSNPSIFQRYPCSHYGRPRVVQPFGGIALQRLMRSAPGTASSISPKQLPCKMFPVCNLGHLSAPQSHMRSLSPRKAFHQKAVGPPPLPGRWPSDPYRPVTGLRKCPLRSCPAGRASLFEVSNHRWTFDPLLRVAARIRIPWVEQSAYQTRLPCKSLQNGHLGSFAYPKPEKLSPPAPFFGRTPNHKSEFWNRRGSSLSDETTDRSARLTLWEQRIWAGRWQFLSFDPRCFRSYIILCSRPHSSLPAPLSPGFHRRERY